jgi:hypothetical protein
VTQLRKKMLEEQGSKNPECRKLTRAEIKGVSLTSSDLSDVERFS